MHTILEDLLPKDVYFRFNPPLKTDIPLDESEEESLDKLVADAVHYLDKKQGRIQATSHAISLEKTLVQYWREKLNDNYLLPEVTSTGWVGKIFYYTYMSEEITLCGTNFELR